jgi:hypothetical protein
MAPLPPPPPPLPPQPPPPLLPGTGIGATAAGSCTCGGGAISSLGSSQVVCCRRGHRVQWFSGSVAGHSDTAQMLVCQYTPDCCGRCRTCGHPPPCEPPSPVGLRRREKRRRLATACADGRRGAGGFSRGACMVGGLHTSAGLLLAALVFGCPVAAAVPCVPLCRRLSRRRWRRLQQCGGRCLESRLPLAMQLAPLVEILQQPMQVDAPGQKSCSAPSTAPRAPSTAPW